MVYSKLHNRMMAAVVLDDAREIRTLAKDGFDVTGIDMHGDTWLDVAIARKCMNAAAAILMRSGSKTTLLNMVDVNGDTVIDKAIGVVSEKFLAMLLVASDKLDLLHTNSKGVSTLDMLMKLNSKTVNDALISNHYLAVA